MMCSSADSPDPFQFALPAALCSSMRWLYWLTSIAMLRSDAISWVRSLGKPKVSWSKNTTSPLSLLPWGTSFKAFSRMTSPLSNVSLKRSSSLSMTSSINDARSWSSGYALPISAMTNVATFAINGSVSPRRTPNRMALLAIRRRTYPRPSFDGMTPSPIKNVQARPWSAMTCKATSLSGLFLYVTLAQSATGWMRLWKESVS